MSPAYKDATFLIQRVALLNDEAAYKQLFELYFPSLKRFAFSLVKSNEIAEEIASDAMINIWRNRNRLQEIGNLKLYLFVSARNLSLNYLKRSLHKKTVSLESIDTNVSFGMAVTEESYITSEMKRKLEMAVHTLPPRCKMVFKLIKEEGLSYREVAELLDISTKTVDAQLVTAIGKITQALKIVYHLH
jgi:RNA polymerase sigma-70 factor (family 1)